MSEQLTEAKFREHADKAIAGLEESFGRLAEEKDIDFDVEGGVLTITFEEGEPGRFIVSPNSSVRQLWLSARVSSYKFDWSESAGQFRLGATGESLKEVLTRLTREQLGDQEVTL